MSSRMTQANLSNFANSCGKRRSRLAARSRWTSATSWRPKHGMACIDQFIAHGCQTVTKALPRFANGDNIGRRVQERCTFETLQLQLKGGSEATKREGPK